MRNFRNYHSEDIRGNPLRMLMQDPLIQRQNFIMNELNNQYQQRNFNNNENNQNTLIKSILIAALLIIITGFIDEDSPCDLKSGKKIQQVCMDDWLDWGCQEKNIEKKYSKQTCQQLQFCMKNPYQYSLKKDKEQQQKFVNGVRDMLHWIKSKVFWISILVFTCLMLILAKNGKQR